MILQATQPTTTAANKLTENELWALTGICGGALLLAMAFVAYAIYKRGLPEITDAGTFTIVGQITFALVVIFVIGLLMLKQLVSSEAGLPILAGLAGVIVGKARGGGGGGAGRGNGAGGGGGGNGGDEQVQTTKRQAVPPDGTTTPPSRSTSRRPESLD